MALQNESDPAVPRAILIVDDEPGVRRLVKAALAQAFPDARLLEADDGLAGIQAADNERPNLVITDIRMPRMDGLDLCRRLRDRDGTCRPEVIAMTGDPTAQDACRAREFGARACLPKPFVLGQLVEAASAALDGR